MLKRWHSGTALALLTDLDLGSVHTLGQLTAAWNSSSHDIWTSVIICTQMCMSSSTDINTSLRIKCILKKKNFECHRAVTTSSCVSHLFKVNTTGDMAIHAMCIRKYQRGTQGRRRFSLSLKKNLYFFISEIIT